MIDLTIRICGAAGQGIATISSTISRILTKWGYYAVISSSVESRIRGGISFFTIRFSDEKLESLRSDIDILVALSQDALDHNIPFLSTKGIVLFDPNDLNFDSEAALPVNFSMILKDNNLPKYVVNTLAVGVVFGQLTNEKDALKVLIQKLFEKKSPEANWDAFRLGYEIGREKHKYFKDIALKDMGNPKMLISGNDAIGFGSLCAGLAFYCGYPMTPSTGILSYLLKQGQKIPLGVIQAESEVAAINMACGAAFTGARTMVGTSGGGFCLMCEGLSWAAMSETPLVMVCVTRPGPSTGMPTRTEQSDLAFLLNAGHGEFLRFVFAPGDPEQAFYLMERAFNLADKYQVPVLILSDKYLGMSEFTLDELNPEFSIERPMKPTEYQLTNGYKRYLVTDSGISPLLFPGETEDLVHVSGDEHDEQTWYAEAAETRITMTNKRFAKENAMEQEIRDPDIYGEGDADYLFITWGSTLGPAKEAIHLLRKEGIAASMVHFVDLWPFPRGRFRELVQKYGNECKLIGIEGNVTGLFSNLVQEQTCIEIPHRILKYDGREFTADYIVKRFKEEVFQ